MVDSVLAPRAQTASGVGGAERARGRGPVDSARAADGVGQRAFGASFAEASSFLQPATNDQSAAGNGLLSTGVQILLAETRSQEAAAPFVPPSKLGQAINTYIETQGQVRETIRSNSGSIAPGSALSSRINSESPPLPTGTLSADPLTGQAPSAAGSPIDSSIDEPDT